MALVPLPIKNHLVRAGPSVKDEILIIYYDSRSVPGTSSEISSFRAKLIFPHTPITQTSYEQSNTATLITNWDQSSIV
jgi:hypothetical protein